MNAIHVVRETGGLGDWVRIFPVLDGLRRKFPDMPIVVHGPSQYRDLVLHGHCWGMDREGCEWVNTDGKRLRSHRGAVLNAGFYREEREGREERQRRGWGKGNGMVIDLNCPARAHERATEGAPTLDRVELFCNRAGVEVSRPEVRFRPLSYRLGCPGPGGVFVHLKSAALIRTWRADNARRLKELLAEPEQLLLTAAGFVEYPLLIEVLSAVKLVITVDCGILHLAGALGVPVLGLFGCTRGDLVCKPYENARWIQAERPAWCRARPCYGYNEQGFGRAECSAGCSALNKIAPERVFEMALELLHHGDTENTENGGIGTTATAETPNERRRK